MVSNRIAVMQFYFIRHIHKVCIKGYIFFLPTTYTVYVKHIFLNLTYTVYVKCVVFNLYKGDYYEDNKANCSSIITKFNITV